jgi:hypothetical protein
MRVAPQPAVSRAPALAAAVLALAALAAVSAPVLAQQARNLRLVTRAGEQRDAVFPAQTKRVEARFDYLDASGATMTLLVYGPGGLRLYRHDAQYEGSGTASVTVSGQDILRGLAAGLRTSSQELQRSAGQAAAAQRGVREYLNGVDAALLLLANAERLLESANLPAAAKTEQRALAAARTELQRLSGRARLLEDSDDAGLRAIALEMTDPARAAVTAATAFEAAVQDLDAVIPSTGHGTKSGRSYDLSVLVDGQPASSTSMWVIRSIYLPSASQQRR